MKGYRSLILAVVFTGMLASCQQAYQDTAAESASTGSPAASLSAPSTSPSQAQFNSSYSLTAKSGELSISADDEYTAAMAEVVYGLVIGATQYVSGNTAAKTSGRARATAIDTSTSTTTGTSSTTTTAGTGLSGYQAVSGDYSTTTTTGTLLYGSADAGTYTAITKYYTEQSDDYTDNAETVYKLYARYQHFVDTSSSTNDIDYTDGSSYILSGTSTLKTRWEWFASANVSDSNPYTITAGIVEEAGGLAIAVQYLDTKLDKLVKGKFVVSFAASSPYTQYNGASSSGASYIAPDYVIKAYSTSNQLVGTYTYSGSTFPAQ